MNIIMRNQVKVSAIGYGKLLERETGSGITTSERLQQTPEQGIHDNY